MIKFFRKHTKQLLAVFLVLLLIVWLGGSALTSITSSRNEGLVYADTKQGPIRVSDQTWAQASTTLISMFNLQWQAPMAWSLLHPQAAIVTQEPISELDWVMLQREVDEAGIKLKGQALDEALQKNLGITPDRVRAIAVRQNITDEHIKEVLGQYIGLSMLLDQVGNSVVPGEAEMRVNARDYMEKVKVNAVVLKASEFVDENQSFTEDEIEDQFKAYRESQPRPNSLEFGYFQPAKIKVEYFKIEPSVIEPILRVNPDEVLTAAKNYWRENRNDRVFRKPPSTQPTTQPAEPEFFKGFTEAREVAIKKVREMMATEAADSIATAIQQRATEPWFTMPRKKNQFKEVPQTVQEEGYANQLKELIPPNIAYDEAVSINRQDWFTLKEARSIPGIGRAGARIPGNQYKSFGDLAFMVEGITEIPKNQNSTDLELYLSPNQFSSRLLKDSQGNIYIFRVTDIDKAHAPESPKIVSEEITRDLRFKAGFDAAKNALKDIQKQVAADGSLEAAWEKADNIKEKLAPSSQQVLKDLSFARADNRYIMGIGMASKAFREKCFELKNLDTSGPKTAVIEIPETAQVALVEWLGEDPLTDQQYEDLRPTMLGRQLLMAKYTAMQAFLEPENIHIRHDFKLRSKKQQEEAVDESIADDEQKKADLQEVEGTLPVDQ